MRDYLFRGKRKGVGEWVYGNLLHTETRGGIGTFTMFYEVYPETVGQYIGLRDKNKKMIFEGDIVSYKYCYKHKLVKGYITYETSAGAFLCVSEKGETYEFFDNMSNIEVIGNIHDNPELIETTNKRR